METEIRKTTVVVDKNGNMAFCPIRNSFCTPTCVMFIPNGCTFPNCTKSLYFKREIQEVTKPLYRTI